MTFEEMEFRCSGCDRLYDSRGYCWFCDANGWPHAMTKIFELERENQRLREALERYADRSYWAKSPGDYHGDEDYFYWVGLDNPIEIAQQALADS